MVICEMHALQVLEAAGAGKDIYMCGHSLGGGLASIVALTLPHRSVADWAAGSQPRCPAWAQLFCLVRSL